MSKPTKQLKKSLSGLSVHELEQVMRKKDQAYDYAKKEGFGDSVCTEFAYTQAAKLASALKGMR